MRGILKAEDAPVFRRKAGLQESVRTNPANSGGTYDAYLWVSNHIFVKPVANKHCYVDAAPPENSGIYNQHRLNG